MSATGLRILGLLVFVGLLAVGGGWWMTRGSPGQPARAGAQAALVPGDKQEQVAKGPPPLAPSKDALTLPGVIEPFESVPVSARLTASIASLRVRDGSSVEKGQLLCVLDDTELRQQIDAARLAYLQCLEMQRKGKETRDVETKRKRVALESAQKELESFALESRLQTDETQTALKRAQRDLADYQALYQAKAVSGDDVRIRQERAEDAQRALERQQAIADAGLASRRKAVEQAQLDMRTEAMSDQNLRANELAVSKAKAELEDRQRRVADTRVTAPIGGTVRIIPRTRTSAMTATGQSAEILGPGVRVYEGDPFLEIATTGRACVRVEVDETDVARLHPGMSAKITGDAFEGRELQGEVATVQITGREAGQGVSLFPVTVLITSPIQGVRMGMTADVTIALASPAGEGESR